MHWEQHGFSLLPKDSLAYSLYGDECFLVIGDRRMATRKVHKWTYYTKDVEATRWKEKRKTSEEFLNVMGHTEGICDGC